MLKYYSLVPTLAAVVIQFITAKYFLSSLALEAACGWKTLKFPTAGVQGERYSHTL